MVMTLGVFSGLLGNGLADQCNPARVTPSKSQVDSVGLSGSFYQSNQFLSCTLSNGHRRFCSPFVVIDLLACQNFHDSSGLI